MELPQELVQQLAADTIPDPGPNFPIPADYMRLPFGIVIKKTTAMLLAVALAVFITWMIHKNRKNKARREK